MKSKPTLKDRFFAWYLQYHDEDDAKEGIWNFFEPYLKKQPAPVFNIPVEKVKEFNEIWPEQKLPTGKYGRCSERELLNSFRRFFKLYPKLDDWNLIMISAERYLAEREKEKWNYTMRSKYFVIKEKAGTDVSELADYYQRELDGTADQIKDDQGFEPKLYD